MAKRTILIGDVHGCIDELLELLNKVSFNPTLDRVILLGDLISRGPDSIEVVRKVQELKLECVKGNHEIKFSKWLKAKPNQKIYQDKPFYKFFVKKDIEFLNNLPSYIKQDNFVFIHAGLKPNISIENQSKNDLSYIRYMDSKYNFISIKKIMSEGKEKCDAHNWTEFWKGPESIIFGHEVFSYENPLLIQKEGFFTYGIDTGCCFGGRLTALILETMEIIQVQSKETYSKPGSFA